MEKRENALWYKDAIFYEVNVRTFYDSNGDGIGDFQGLIQKLPHLRDLGVTALRLLPFYPSPLRDDGYDIADYRNVHPDCGTLYDFKLFVQEAHAYGLKVITELVVNHTSDQHPWFQAARRAKPGSRKRNYYVWSDTDTKYAGTRIIFLDTEKSNWTWDPVAGAYYWHRFFSHQPDLNYDNPQVLKAIVRTMRFWLDIGVDGFCLDAIPYLCEREGTINENLPETHVVLKEMRRLLDQHYEARMLLADANQWPEDVRPYFGDEDECHMAFHFPLAAALFLAISSEDRSPIVELINESSFIPPNGQWALLLRNHDELSLDMLTDENQKYLFGAFTANRRARWKLGIRRRLAPLMDNDINRIKLMFSCLFSLPGTPFIYYGDEIGMGDNIYLDNCKGLCTPMQWTAEQNGGFSRADPEQLYIPVNIDPEYQYEAVNVEIQEHNSSSLLWWMKSIIAFRKKFKAFSRGSLTFLQPHNRKILSYIRRYENDTIVCIANLSRFSQPLELDLSPYRGMNPIELIGGTEFPIIEDKPYFFGLAPFSFYWFQLTGSEITPAFYSCFISYSHEDKLFARQLHDTLQARGIRCWLDEHQLLPGQDIYEEIDRGIRLWDKVLLCCSKNSLSSWWVDKEISTAFDKEQVLMKQSGKKPLALIPLNLDGYLFTDQCRTGKVTEIKTRVVADFTGWEQDNKKLQEQIERLVRALQSGPVTG